VVKLAALLIVLCYLLTGCTSSVRETTETRSPVNSSTEVSTRLLQTSAPATTPNRELPLAAQAETAAFPMEVKDQLGRIVKIKKAPERIISLAPGNTEILYILGLGDKIVGVDQYSDYPPEAKTKPVIGGFSTTNIEKVISADPNLILAANIHKDKVIPVLESLGYTVVALNPQTVDEVLESITLVGKITGKKGEAAEVVAGLSSRIQAVTGKTSLLSDSQRPTVFYAVWPEPLMSAGNATFQSDLINKAGGSNISQSLNGFATISIEAVVNSNPQIMITDDQSMSGGGANFQFISTRPELANTAARKSGSVYTVKTALISHPGPRLVDALEQFAKLIHPEIFK
jgi:iron complex transport system substrate-binding protein